MKIGDKWKCNSRFESGLWTWADGKEPQGPHHLPSGVVAVVRELKDVDSSPVVIFSIIREDGKETSPDFRTTKDVFENFFDELSAEREK